MHFFMERLRSTLFGMKHVFNATRVEDVILLHMSNGDKYRVTVERIS